MKILWVKSDFLHPATRGGQIRTLEMLKRLHLKHEVHYVALDDGLSKEGPARAGEYSTCHYAVPHRAPERGSFAFGVELLWGLLSPEPVAVFRWKSQQLRELVARLRREQHFDAVVCDFLVPAASMDDFDQAVLFQHNVEALIWQRHAEQKGNPLRRLYMSMQAAKMLAFERQMSRKAKRVICVSQDDARISAEQYGVSGAAWVPTGVDTEFFNPAPAKPGIGADLVFLGSMDWLPNMDGARWLQEEILQGIWKRRPETTIALAGRKPSKEILAMAADPRVTVTGTLDDVRPWLHGSKLSIVPLRIGGGTRLKIYESMAAGCPVISTTIGAEGLDVTDGETICLADTADAFAAACVDLLAEQSKREAMAARALDRVRRHYSWEAVADRFAELLTA